LHKEDGGHIAHLTLTFSHTRFDSLRDNLDNLLKALNKFRSGKAYQKIRNKMQMIGSIRVFEVTYSDSNGFHPHVHLALFYMKDEPLFQIHHEMSSLWLKALNKFGLDGREGIALKLQQGENSDDYLTKWGLENELSKAHTKKGKDEEHVYPFDFLRKFKESEDFRFLALYKEYAEVFKGKRQIMWSPGLKGHFLIGEKSDELLATEKTEQADLLGLLSWEEWKVILKNDSRADLLDLSERIGFEKAKMDVLTRNKKESSRPEDSHVLEI
jgi:hypothetical protein